jgi:hypothetical protein
LGWYDSGRQHLPVEFVSAELPAAEEIQPNTIGIGDGMVSTSGIELGSGLVEQRINFFIDVWAESAALGMHLSGDIKDILEGRFSTTLGFEGTSMPVYDYRLATPTEMFQVEILRVMLDHAEFAAGNRPWKNTYYGIQVTLEDTYASEDYS